jgi:hypothetical protein
MRPGLIGMAVAAGVVGLGVIGLYAWRKGGIAPAAASVGGAVVDAAGGLASGVVGGVGASVGLPTPAQTTTDAEVSRWIIDNYGWLEASKWTGAPALMRAMAMDAGTGKPPPAGSDLARRFPIKPPTLTTGDFARMDRSSSAADDGATWWGVGGSAAVSDADASAGPGAWTWGF